jgi:hypothetical protein
MHIASLMLETKFKNIQHTSTFKGALCTDFCDGIYYKIQNLAEALTDSNMSAG